ncbi:hypothetical protein ACN9MJ_06510 [Acidovorax facilis]|uniref:hypothetical protein n=1 Tax=Acidovorax facilis TaxID=12917 RepID=UPI003CEA6668
MAASSPLPRELTVALSHHVEDASKALGVREREIINEMASRGMMNSSPTAHRLAEAAEGIFDKHVKSLYDDALQLSAAYLGESLTSRLPDVQELFRSSADYMSARLIAAAMSAAPPIASNFIQQIDAAFKSRSSAIVARYVARILIELSAIARPRTPVTQSVFNGPVVNAVIGNNNSIQGTQTNGFTAEKVQALLSALTVLRAEVASDTRLPSEERVARVRNLDVLQSEIEQPNPNVYTVGGLLNGVSTWTQGMAATPGAVAAINELMSLFR